MTDSTEPAAATGDNIEDTRTPAAETPLETVGETRQALADMLGIAKAAVQHYALVVDSDGGTILKFCCDDRHETAALLRHGAGLLLRDPGESMRADGARPPMPASRLEAEGDGPLLDPDCRDGKCGSCVGAPCEHECHAAESWWVTTGPLLAGGEKRAGPYLTQDRAMAARALLERAEGHERYWVDEETASEAAAVPGRTAPGGVS